MSTSTAAGSSIRSGMESRVLREGYGPGAWHGPDLKAALADVTPAVAFWRPAAGRHNIAEIALHHAYYVRAVRAQISGRPADPFVAPGEDWFDLNGERDLAWREVLSTVEGEQQRLATLIGDIDAGTTASAVGDEERFGLVLGITSHAIYHAGQVQLLKRLRAA